MKIDDLQKIRIAQRILDQLERLHSDDLDEDAAFLEAHLIVVSVAKRALEKWFWASKEGC